MKKTIISLVLLCTFLCSNSESSKDFKFSKHRDYVPNEETAIKVAEAIWLPIFGESIYENKPFIATLKGGVWIVTGTLPNGSFGGTPTMEVRKYDCKVLSITSPK